MKRQQHSSDNTDCVKNGGRKKKVKRAVEDPIKESIDGGGGGDVTVFPVENLYGWEEEEWQWLSGGGMDELMSWGCYWSPFWGVDFVDLAYGDFFSDVAWDDDIWNLKNIVEIPQRP